MGTHSSSVRLNCLATLSSSSKSNNNKDQMIFSLSNNYHFILCRFLPIGSGCGTSTSSGTQDGSVGGTGVCNRGVMEENEISSSPSPSLLLPSSSPSKSPEEENNQSSMVLKIPLPKHIIQSLILDPPLDMICINGTHNIGPSNSSSRN